ncbi:hypothetical protein O6H91_Y466100 [Diphasiastrum complanatum]|nr:hypothetical protein O6H91_Y466100 [Diphasiastrum complanatum]
MWKVGVSMALLVSVTAVSLGVSIGRLISLPSGQEGINILCNNTLQGPYLLSDDRGYICTTTVLDTVTGCCPEDAQQFSCRGCNLSSSCCDSYEYCVACCLDPKKTTTERALRSKVSKQATAKTYSSVFEYCSGRCRHNSASVVHENAYASEEHHCFFLKPNPTEQVKKFQEDDVMDISLIIGRQGQSCDSACQGRGQLCKLSKLTILNKCSILQKYMGCKGACTASLGSDQPAQVVSMAPRHLHPGACLFSSESNLLSCHGAHPYTRRLCPCA